MLWRVFAAPLRRPQRPPPSRAHRHASNTLSVARAQLPSSDGPALILRPNNIPLFCPTPLRPCSPVGSLRRTLQSTRDPLVLYLTGLSSYTAPIIHALTTAFRAVASSYLTPYANHAGFNPGAAPSLVFSPTPSLGSVIPPTPTNETAEYPFEPYSIANDEVAYVSAPSISDGPHLSPNILGLRALVPLTPIHSPVPEDWLQYLVTPTKDSDGIRTPRPPHIPTSSPSFAPFTPQPLATHGLREVHAADPPRIAAPVDFLLVDPIAVPRQDPPLHPSLFQPMDYIDPRLLNVTLPSGGGPRYEEQPTIAHVSAAIAEVSHCAITSSNGLRSDSTAQAADQHPILDTSQAVPITSAHGPASFIAPVEVVCGARTQANGPACQHVFKITGLRCTDMAKHFDSAAHIIEYRPPHPLDKTQENTRICPDSHCLCNAPHCEERKQGKPHRAHVKDLQEHWRIQHLRYKWYCDFCQDVEWSSAFAFGRHRAKCRQASVLERQLAVQKRAGQRQRRGPEVSRCTVCAILFQTEDAHRQHILEHTCTAVVPSLNAMDLQPQAA